MIPFHLHLAACSVLLIAAICRRMTAGKEATAHRFLFPYIFACFAFGAVVAYLLTVEIFVARYSGARFEGAAPGSPLGGPYGWAAPALPILPLLPGLGIVPWIGRRAVVVAALALLASLPGWLILSR